MNALERLFAAFVLVYLAGHLLSWRGRGYNVGPVGARYQVAAVGGLPARTFSVRPK